MSRKHGYDVALMKPDSAVHYNWGGIISWIIATVTGFLFTNNAVWSGPFAHGIFRDNSLGVFVSALAAIVCIIIAKLLSGSRTPDSSEKVA